MTGGEYRPTWLIRVFDWRKVPGTEAVDGYHTISYCWEQSGEVIKKKTTNNGNDEYSFVDNGQHCIVEGYNLYEDEILEVVDSMETEEDGYQNENKEDGYKNFYENANEEAINSTECLQWCKPKSKTPTIRNVTYDQLLQQVCKDFQVTYVWYDKVCIDQADNKAKSREINQMHKIYRNACYTIAMIPEVILYDPKDFEHQVFGKGHKAQKKFIDDVWYSCWFKRSWTLEEVMMSRRILIVGTNTNMFQHSLHSADRPTTVDFLSNALLNFGGSEQNEGSVNQALAFAHFRTSTKPHDKIYTLRNTFSYMFNYIETSYSTDIKTIFYDFYRRVAMEDFSILCFGSNRYFDGNIYNQSTIDNYNLPSWTGVAGHHITDRVTSTTHPQLRYRIDNAMLMHIATTRYWKISITPYDHGCYSLSKNSIEDSNSYLEKISRIRLARFNEKWTNMTTADKDTVLFEWLVNMQNAASLYMTHYHQRQDSLLTQARPLTLTEDCEECIVLPILFNIHGPLHSQPDADVSNFFIVNYARSYCLPVLRECTKGNGQYRVIGIYYVGEHVNLYEPTFEWGHFIGREASNTDDTVEILDALFENNCYDVPKEFIIE
ncbi:hypothetical protein INT45_012993 [Circinella minor]|uniref:Heterokaryon incompatibility domain-containing protein n=1 Tax=Circinella minor TaxID=1195481 RepID=A0A8H7RZQ7_9FUNG|nr:hypothetical protein INT45_012993 [Circinella minor]